MTTVGSNYKGAAGEQYFAYQRQGGADRGEVIARKFRPYISPSHSLLDFGCGAGWVLLALDAREKVGVEVNPRAIAMARDFGLDVRGSLAEIEDARFDVVISNHALEHTLHPYIVLQGLSRVLRPNGRLILHLPIDDWRMERDAHAPDQNHHLFTWTPLLIANLLGEAGFVTVDARVVNYGAAGRFTGVLGRRLPARAFNVVSAITAILRRRRELRVVARRKAGEVCE